LRYIVFTVTGTLWWPRLVFTMRGDWDLIPEGRAEWIGYGIALIVVILAALWINR